MDDSILLMHDDPVCFDPSNLEEIVMDSVKTPEDNNINVDKVEVTGVSSTNLEEMVIDPIQKENNLLPKNTDVPKQVSVKCCVCEYVANDASLIKEHEMNQHGMIKCSKCDTTIYKSLLRNHMTENHAEILDNNLYKCNDCSFTTVTNDELQEHKKDQHKREKQDVSENVFLHSCISCDFKTNDYNSLRLHIDSDHRPTTPTASVNIEEQPRNSQVVNTYCVTCPFCNLQSKNLNELKTHFDNVHSDNKDKHSNKQDEIQNVGSNVCSNCPKCKFSGNKSELDKHLKSKHGRKHVCEECGRNFMDVNTLKLHF